MAASARLKTLLALLMTTLATSLSSPIPSSSADFAALQPRSPIINNASGELRIFDSNTGLPIPQGAATDGGGNGTSTPALIWIIFSIIIGAPMALAGLRGWRATTGTGTGLALAVCIWAAFINSEPAGGIDDLLLTVIVISTFLIGFVFGLFEFGRVAGITCLGISSGLSFGIRIMLLRPGLLFPGDHNGLFAVNWVFIALLGVGGGSVLIWWQRIGIVFACASLGTFLTALGIDLMVNRQSGMSRGLRFLFDRNVTHLQDILSNGYKPPTSTFIIIVASLALSPLLAYGQHRVFKAPFNRHPPDRSDLNSLNLGNEVQEKRETRLSVAWGSAKSKLSSRFSL